MTIMSYREFCTALEQDNAPDNVRKPAHNSEVDTYELFDHVKHHVYYGTYAQCTYQSYALYLEDMNAYEAIK